MADEVIHDEDGVKVTLSEPDRPLEDASAKSGPGGPRRRTAGRDTLRRRRWCRDPACAGLQPDLWWQPPLPPLRRPDAGARRDAASGGGSDGRPGVGGSPGWFPYFCPVRRPHAYRCQTRRTHSRATPREPAKAIAEVRAEAFIVCLTTSGAAISMIGDCPGARSWPPSVCNELVSPAKKMIPNDACRMHAAEFRGVPGALREEDDRQ